jgi:hypothetical protein
MRGVNGPLVAHAIAGPLTVVAGLVLYWIDYGGFLINRITTPTGLSIAVGAFATLIAIHGGFPISGI